MTFTVPAANPGTATVSATDSASNTGSAQLAVYAPSVALTAPGAPAGHGLTVTGSGWPAGDSIYIQIGATTPGNNVACSLSAGRNGTIAGTQYYGGCQVPTTVPGGRYKVYAVDGNNPAIAVTGPYFNLRPALVLTPGQSNAGSPVVAGQTVSVMGYGFGAKTTVSNFKFGPNPVSTVPSSQPTNAQGSFTGPVTFTVPSVAPGNVTVSAADPSNRTGSAVIAVYAPTVSVTTPASSGSPGQGVTVFGSGWPSGDTIYVQIGSKTLGTDVACSFYASSDGTFADNGDNCTVPDNLPAGAKTLFAIDQTNTAGVATGDPFMVQPVLVLTPAGLSPDTTGPTAVGVTVTINGHGFTAGSTVSNFTFNGNPVTTTPSSVNVTQAGNFAVKVTFTVPSVAAGTYTVSGTDASSQTGGSSLMVYAPTISVKPTSGSAGDPLQVSGTGWPPGDYVYAKIGSTTLDGTNLVCQLYVNPDGTLSDPGNCSVPNPIATGSKKLFAYDIYNPGVQANGAAFTVH
jgi:hypothetical protein